MTWVVGYRETHSPTFSGTARGEDVPASGRFWIDPATGAVLRTEMILGGTRKLQQRATVTVTYALDETLGFRVPIEMRETYDKPRQKNSAVINAVATYSDFSPVRLADAEVAIRDSLFAVRRSQSLFVVRYSPALARSRWRASGETGCEFAAGVRVASAQAGTTAIRART